MCSVVEFGPCAVTVALMPCDKNFSSVACAKALRACKSAFAAFLASTSGLIFSKRASKLARFEKIKPEVDAKKAAKADLQARKAFAQATEEKFLSQGMSATVTAQGPNSTTLHIKFVLVSKAFAYQVQ